MPICWREKEKRVETMTLGFEARHRSYYDDFNMSEQNRCDKTTTFIIDGNFHVWCEPIMNNNCFAGWHEQLMSCNFLFPSFMWWLLTALRFVCQTKEEESTICTSKYRSKHLLCVWVVVGTLPTRLIASKRGECFYSPEITTHIMLHPRPQDLPCKMQHHLLLNKVQMPC